MATVLLCFAEKCLLTASAARFTASALPSRLWRTEAYSAASGAFGWLLAQTDAFAEQVVDAEDFLDIMMKLEVGFGIAFELPLAIFYLSTLHLVPYKTFRSQWRYVYVGLLTLSACVTPDASPVTMIIMFAALIGLYEIALAIARVVITAKDGREALKWSREDYEAHEFAED